MTRYSYGYFTGTVSGLTLEDFEHMCNELELEYTIDQELDGVQFVVVLGSEDELLELGGLMCNAGALAEPEEILEDLGVVENDD